MTNHIATSSYGEQYEIVGRGLQPTSSCAVALPHWSLDYISTRSLVARLNMSRGDWCSLLIRMGISVPPNIYTDPAMWDAITTLCLRGYLSIYKLPKLSQLPALSAGGGMGYCFVPGPKPHTYTDLTPEKISNLEEAKALLGRLKANEGMLVDYVGRYDLLRSLFNVDGNITRRFAELLAKSDILAYKIPVNTNSAPKGTGAFELAAATGPMYEPVRDLPPPLNEKPAEAPKFKRQHKNGYAEDPYTLQADGKPLGAKEGVMPKTNSGLKHLPEHHDLLVEQGYPHLNVERKPGLFNKDYVNFSDAHPDVLSPGTKLYRVLDEQANPAGAYWAAELPENKAAWRGNYAVKDSWNDNGYYTEYTVPPGDGLKVWRGTTAGQKYEVANGKRYYLEGGKEQIFVSPNTIAPGPKQFTPWTDATL